MQSALPTPHGDKTTFPILICLLENFLLLKAGQSVALRPGGKSEILLSHLSLQIRHGIPREKILELLWPSIEASVAGQRLDTLAFSLRKMLESALNDDDPILYSEGSYRLNLEAGIAVDVAQFDTLVRRGDELRHIGEREVAMRAYSRAVDLYRGDLCLNTDVYAIIERERLRARYLTILAHIADYHYGISNFDICLEYAWRLLSWDPCREDAHRLVMRCNVRRGERAEALRQYRVCVAILHRELNVSPEASTTALFEQIRSDPINI